MAERKGKPCQFKDGCHRVATTGCKFCPIHRGDQENTCRQEGCDAPVAANSYPWGYCSQHVPNREGRLVVAKVNNEKRREARRVLVARWERDSRLRAKHLDAVAAAQNGLCAGFWTSEEVKDGKPVNQCQWGVRTPPRWAQELDHITPYAQTRDDSRENLQMLCRCCHGGKTAAERDSADIGLSMLPCLDESGLEEEEGDAE
jgi:5-methylcytosine-specific restriction endonuclease McrA